MRATQILEQLSNKAMRPRHWQQIITVRTGEVGREREDSDGKGRAHDSGLWRWGAWMQLTKSQALRLDEMKLENILELPILQHRDEVEEVRADRTRGSEAGARLR